MLKEGKHGQTNLCSVTARGQIQSSAVFNLLDNDWTQKSYSSNFASSFIVWAAAALHLPLRPHFAFTILHRQPDAAMAPTKKQASRDLGKSYGMPIA